MINNKYSEGRARRAGVGDLLISVGPYRMHANELRDILQSCELGSVFK